MPQRYMSYRVTFLLLILALTSCQPFGGKKRLRIGTNHSEPFNYWDENSKPTGFAVEVVSRAAQIAGYELEWVRASGPEQAFEDGVAEIWPFVTFYEERRKLIHLTKDWWRVGTILYFPKSAKITKFSELAGKRLAITSPQRRFLPAVALHSTAKVEVFDNPKLAFEAMCTGRADAALLDYRIAEGVMVNWTPSSRRNQPAFSL
jgi:ABC-type amino acid transport substrate-binding protein